MQMMGLGALLALGAIAPAAKADLVSSFSGSYGGCIAQRCCSSTAPHCTVKHPVAWAALSAGAKFHVKMLQ